MEGASGAKRPKCCRAVFRSRIDLARGWFFTGETLYPNLFSLGRNAWVFYFVRTSNPRQYVDLGNEEFFTLE